MTQILQKNGQLLKSGGGVLQKPTPYMYTNTSSLSWEFGLGQAATVPTDLASDFNFNTDEPFSVACWIKPSNLPNNRFRAICSHRSSTSSAGWMFATYHQSGQDDIQLLVWDGVTDIRVDSHAFNQTNWNHVACTYDGTKANTGLNLYVNGSLSNANKFSGPLSAVNPPGSNFTIGIAAAGSTQRWEGGIDELSVWKRDLTQEEIQSMRTGNSPQDVSTISGFSSDCIAWYRMGDFAEYNTQKANDLYIPDQSTFSNHICSSNMDLDNVVTDIP